MPPIRLKDINLALDRVSCGSAEVGLQREIRELLVFGRLCGKPFALGRWIDSALAWRCRDDALCVIVWLLAAGARPGRFGALARAISGGRWDVVRVLVDAAVVDVQFQDSKCLTDAVSYGDVKILRLLLDAGADPKTNTDALFSAVLMDRCDMVSMLLDAGARPDPVRWAQQRSMFIDNSRAIGLVNAALGAAIAL